LRTSYRGLKSESSDNHFQQKAFLFSTFLGFLLIGFCDFYFLESPRGSILFFGVAGLMYVTHAKENCIARPVFV
jgi:hypothetical protein